MQEKSCFSFCETKLDRYFEEGENEMAMELFSSISTSKYNFQKGMFIQRIYLSGYKVTHLLGGYFKKRRGVYQGLDRSSVIKKIDCFLNTSINKKSQNLITQILTSFMFAYSF